MDGKLDKISEEQWNMKPETPTPPLYSFFQPSIFSLN